MELGRSLQALCDAGVDFVIVGGVSATLHGSAQVTFDLDICYSRSADNLKRLAKALAPFRPRPRGVPDHLPFVWDESTLRNGSLFTLTTELGDIDCLARSRDWERMMRLGQGQLCWMFKGTERYWSLKVC